MVIRDVIGDTYPEVFLELQGGILINVLVEEVVLKGWMGLENEVVKYSYKQVFTTETNELELEKIKTRMLVKIYKQYLDATEHKINIGYEPKAGEDLEVIIAKRSEAKAFVDSNKEEVGALN